MIPNTTHWIQCNNELASCPIFDGDTRITVLVTTTNGILDGELREGQLLVTDGPGENHAYAIANNTYITTDTVMSVELYEPIRVAWDDTAVITLSKNMYHTVVVTGTTGTGIACGVPNAAIPINRPQG